MMDLFYSGGMLFMSILTFELVGLLIISGRYLLIRNPDQGDLDLIKSVGLFAAVTGIFCQMISFYEALQAIEQIGSVSPAMLAGGIKVSFITTLYGLLIFLISLLIYSIMKTWLSVTGK